MVHIRAETGCPLAVEDHQLSQALPVADRILVVGDRPLSFGNGRTLPSKYIRPKRSINGHLVRLQRVLAQTEADMKKRPVALIRRVRILKHS